MRKIAGARAQPSCAGAQAVIAYAARSIDATNGTLTSMARKREDAHCGVATARASGAQGEVPGVGECGVCNYPQNATNHQYDQVVLAAIVC
jgi:hypothetical protein